MGIKTVKYKSNSIVYFKGDTADRVYILKKGSIVTKTTDLKTNEDLLTMIKVGEFIGVKNVISNQPYSETVSTLTDSELVVFYKQDFENFILNNSRIMMQTLAVFSNQLRKIHVDIRQLENIREQKVGSTDPEKNLYDLALYFMKQKKNDYSNYCFKKYLAVYPSGKYRDQAESYMGSGTYYSEEERVEIEEESSLYFQEGQNYLTENNYLKAHECFAKVLSVTDGYHKVDAQYFNGACLFQLKKYKECLNNYSDFLVKHKDYKKLNEVLFYVGCSYKEIGDIEQSTLFLKEVTKKAEGTPLAQRALKALKG